MINITLNIQTIVDNAVHTTDLQISGPLPGAPILYCKISRDIWEFFNQMKLAANVNINANINITTNQPSPSICIPII
jgi:hypothetical protein